jgi:hydroxylamine reductase (hybrid-cluster protein)
MPSDASVVGSLVSLNETTRIAAAGQQPLVPYVEDGLLCVVDEMRKAGSPNDDVTKVLEIVLQESRSKVFMVKLCIIIIMEVVPSLHPTLNPEDRLKAHGNEEQTKQAAETTKQAAETTKQATEATKQAEFDARARQAVAEEATKQAEIIARTKREEDERRAKQAEDERRFHPFRAAAIPPGYRVSGSPPPSVPARGDDDGTRGDVPRSGAILRGFHAPRT